MAGLKRGGVRVLVLCILMTSAGCCQREGDRKAPLEGSLDLGDGVVIDLVYIRPGKFMMGSDKDYMNDEKPVHEVEITKGFWIGKYEVTQGQHEKVMGGNPSHFKGADKPVEQVSWNEAMTFCRKVSGMTGKNVRLPTEAEWEYACRGGSQREYCYGNERKELGDYAWIDSNSGYRTHAVGQKKPNEWGLYDVHGNVWEWCGDWYDSNYYAMSPHKDPTGPDRGIARSMRGDCWIGGKNPWACRSAKRGGHPPDHRVYNVGYRVVVDSE